MTKTKELREAMSKCYDDYYSDINPDGLTNCILQACKEAKRPFAA